jgi:serine/threonine protein kinase
LTSNEPPKAAQHLVGGRYSLAPDIRQGGMSVVQKAYDTQEHRFCAIKRMKGAQDDLRWKESFNREYAALCDLSSHPNIISLYEANFDESGFYMVLEWAPANLVDWIKQKGALSWDQFYAQIGRPLLEALAFAQGRGWSHRDIKPSNILLADNGVPKIADYGIAKQMEKPAIGLTFAQFRSVPFAPPEDDGGGELRSSRDCFSWAAVAIYCLTGKTPSDYGTLAELAAGLDRETTPIAILQATLSHTPEERPPLATALLTELNAFEADRLSKLPARQMCHLHLEPACIQGILRSLDVGDRGEIEVALLEELNDVRPGLKKLQTPEGKPRLRVFAVTWAFEMFRLDATRLSVRRAWQLKPSELEQYREGSFRPELIFTFNLPPNPELASEELDTLFLDLEAFEVDERQRALIARRERIFRVWYAFLRSKADFEARRENAITYVNAKLNGSILKLSTDLPAPAEVVGQSRVIRLASGGHIFCDIIDVNLDEVIVQVTSGDLGRLPQRGLLELNTLAAEKSIERQRSALDAINFDRAVSPRLKTIIVEPKSARPPIAVSAPKIGGGPLDLDKKEVLVRALGLQDILAIQGPPGTGKTRLIEEIIVQYLDRNPRNRVLVSSQTHVALDNVIERVRVRQPRIDIVRIGRLDDPKIGLPSRDLVLDRKAQAWAEQVRQRAHTFMTTWAQRKGIDRSAIELGMLAERLIRLLGQARALQDTLDAAKAQMRAADERAEQKLTDTGSAESPEIETAAVEAQDAAGATESALTKLKVAIQEVRDRLNLSGTYGAELAKQTDEGELKEWSTMLLGDSDDERTCRTLLELQEDWTLRVGRSSDFHAAMLVSAQIVAGTCIGIAGVRGMNQVSYDLCIVDEASKATATEILVPMSRSRRGCPGRC